MTFVRLGLKILCGDFGEFFITFVACESFIMFIFNMKLWEKNIIFLFRNASDSRD